MGWAGQNNKKHNVSDQHYMFLHVFLEGSNFIFDEIPLKKIITGLCLGKTYSVCKS